MGKSDDRFVKVYKQDYITCTKLEVRIRSCWAYKESETPSSFAFALSYSPNTAL